MTPTSLTPPTGDNAFGALLGAVAKADAHPLLEPGRRVGEVILHGAIGRGGMGEVWEGWHEGLSRIVALKLLIHGTEDGIAEAVLLERLRHPHVVAVHGFGEVEGTPYVVMERLDGETLRERIDRIGAMAPQEAIGLTQQLASALGHVHAHGLVHRDVKPSNVVLLHRDSLELKLIDFGLSRPSPQMSDEARELGHGGTPAYMSPEQRQTPHEIDGRSDLWSATAVVYFALTGQRPGARERVDLPEAVCHWLDRGMATEQRDRPATPHQWARSFKQAVERGGAPLRYPQALYEVGVDVGRGPTRAPPAGGQLFVLPRWAKLLALLVGLGVVLWLVYV